MVKPEAKDEELVAVLKAAYAYEFIEKLPEGIDTRVGEQGEGLSEGQAQRLAIARAILARSSILILDEATSAIDTRTEIAIQRAMLNLMKGKTTFVIAHRLSTIRNADEIIAIKDGEIIERGTHNELIEKDGFYANLYNSQFRTGMEL
jgi:ATP-binding cassette subfamily B protein